MTQEEKQLLLCDLCARLPYGVKVKQGEYVGELRSFDKYTISFNNSCALPKPYLRPMSSMTEEERHIFDKMTRGYTVHQQASLFDWLNAHHFDFRNLIERGLAISTEEFNPYEKV